ncbi:MAG TPA: uroporphyrinogen decarboxylase family protein [Thermodesulfobacteriota bacterium]|nr:uroporphyrinogen decarboxylase family protein [Thermodesulfobacteriota bacterium]
MKAEMNSRERIMAALRREEPDRVPFAELAIDRALAERLMGWPATQTAAGGSITRNPFTVEESKALASFLGVDCIGYLLRAPALARQGIGKEGRGFMGEGLIKSEADLEKIQLPDPHGDEMYREAEHFARNKGDYALVFVTRIGFFQTVLGMGTENFLVSLYTNRSLVEKILDIYFDWMAVVAERMCGIGYDIFWTTDDYAYKTGMFFSPAIFREVIAPRYRRVLNKVTIPWFLHSDGNITESLDTLVELGVAATHPNEKGAMDIRGVKRKYGDRLCVIGNVDLNILGMGTPEETDREVRELIRDLAPGGGYMISSGNSLASYLQPECVLAMAEAVRKYGKYPIQIGS